MKELTEIVYPSFDGTTDLVVVREGTVIYTATPRTPAEALAIGHALLHVEGQLPENTLAAMPTPRKLWISSLGRELLIADTRGCKVPGFLYTHADALELMQALDAALHIKFPSALARGTEHPQPAQEAHAA